MVIGDRVKGLSADVLQALSTRIELFGLELQQAKEDLPRLLALWVIGLLALMFALALFTFFVVVVAWDTPYRDWVVVALFLIYAIVGLALIWHVRQQLRAGALHPFSATIEELQRDVQFLTRARIGHGSNTGAASSDEDKSS
jgi:uncharacterized membrane protein YqjE